MAGSVTVTVACKLPHGLILRLYDMVDFDEPAAGGGYRTIKRAQPRPGQVVIKGYLSRYRGASIQPLAESSSYALTHGVDKDFFDRWLVDNKDNPAVVNKLIFASDKPETVQGIAREHAKVRTGLEPINPSRLPRGIETATKKEAAA